MGGRRYTTKVLTTARAPEEGVMQGIAAMVLEAGIAASDVGLIIHGTTLATNALIERQGARRSPLVTSSAT